MIEIIEKPQHKCEICGCVYTFDKEDFKEKEEYQGYKEISWQVMRDIYETITYVECPICGNKFVLKKETEAKRNI